MDNLYSLISDTNNIIQSFIINELEKRGIEGLVLSHGAILLGLTRSKALNYKELSLQSGKSQQTVTTLIRKLVNEGYVEVFTDKNDKRSKLCRLTKKGKEFTPIMLEISENVYKIQYQGFTFDEIVAVRELLEKVNSNFKKRLEL